MDIYDILTLIGGIGLFLYGMKYLGKSLEHLAGAKLEKTLEKMTDKRYKGFSFGILVTAVVQSSSATTIMLVGFANAGIMKLVQSVPVLLGANIGTTVTGQILRIGDISGSGSSLIGLLKPSSFAPLIIGIAAFIMLLSKKKRPNDIAAILMGFGVLFFGMNTMELALEPLKTSESFREAFTTFDNPIVGFGLGILLAMILQSSSAAVGVIQAVAAATGSITYAVAIPMVMGISVGKLFPVILSSIGTKRVAQQVTIAQLLVSSSGAVAGMGVVYLILSPLGLISWDTVMTRGSIADLNTIFNIIVSLLFFPLCGVVAKVVEKLRHSDPPSKIDEELAALDDRLLNTPAVALEQARKVINSMGNAVVENLGLAIALHDDPEADPPAILEDNELFLDKSETYLSDYMVKITACRLRDDEQKLASEIMHSIMDFERIGDHCIKISEVATYNKQEKIEFSQSAKSELKIIFDAVSEIIKNTVDAFTLDDKELAHNVEPLEELTKSLAEIIKQRHIKRLQSGNCTVQSGISLTECLTSLERIAAYCSNIALHVIEKHTAGDGFDMHSYASFLHNESLDYARLYAQYEEKYLNPLMSLQ
ncbi:MAG: Na/Pi cotransporter family protein [Lachnospiraceae bacterium]|nr:Na/Pi cotransporter family protein [Lachnospiraceae bacterium]